MVAVGFEMSEITGEYWLVDKSEKGRWKGGTEKKWEQDTEQNTHLSVLFQTCSLIDIGMPNILLNPLFVFESFRTSFPVAAQMNHIDFNQLDHSILGSVIKETFEGYFMNTWSEG